jgi:hypothetical protein
MQPLAGCAATTQKQIDRATYMAIVVVIRQAHFQQTMQRKQIQHVLQFVARVQNLRAHSPGRIGRILRTEPVRLVIRHVVAAIVFEHQIDKTLEHAIQLRRFESGPLVAIERQARHHLVERQRIHRMGSEPELHFSHVRSQLRQHHMRHRFALQSRQVQRCAQQI